MIFPVLFLSLFLGGCSGYYSQKQVDGLMQQEKVSRQAEVDSLKQRADDLQKQMDNFFQKLASATIAQPAPSVASSTTPSGVESGKYVTYLISKESTLKYCNGGDDNSDAYRKTINTEVESEILTANVVSGAVSQVNLVKQILSLSTACGVDLGSLDIKVKNGVVEIPRIDAWAGISIRMCSCVPQAEVNLLRLPGITKVVWDSK